MLFQIIKSKTKYNYSRHKMLRRSFSTSSSSSSFIPHQITQSSFYFLLFKKRPFLSGMFTASSVAATCYYFNINIPIPHYFNKNTINDASLAFAAVNIPISDSPISSSSSSSSNWMNSNNQQVSNTNTMSPDDDGIVSYVFCKKSIPSSIFSSSSSSSSSSLSLLREELNTPGRGGITPLMLAAYQGDVTSCEALLIPKDEKEREKGHTLCDPEVRSITPKDRQLAKQYFGNRFVLPEGFTALETAVLGGNQECIKLVAQYMGKEIAGGKEAERMAQIAAQKGGFNYEGLMNALKLGREMRKERLRKRRAQFPLEARLAEKIVGQKGAIAHLAAAIRRKENGWASDDKPVVAMLLGSSGVGKSMSAKLIAQYINEGRDASSSTNENGDDDEEGTLSDQDIQDHAQSLPPPFNQIFMSQAKQQRQKIQQQQRAKSNNSSNSENDCFIRLDMSEYQSRHEVSKMTGAPAGYVGYGEKNNLVGRLLKCPSAVVLFDEIEKAHPDLLTILLQLFDEGRLTDGTGKTVDASKATFLMTSNLGQREIADESVRMRTDAAKDVAAATATSSSSSSSNDKMKSMKTDNNNSTNNAAAAQEEAKKEYFSRDFMRNTLHPILRRHFGRDEFIGRINEIVCFMSFTDQEQEQLTEKQMELWQERAKRKHNIELRFSHGVTKEIKKEFDLRYGARSLQYAIDRMVISPIAREHELGNVRPNTVVAMRTKEEESSFAAIPDFAELADATTENTSSSSSSSLLTTTNCGNGFVLDIANLKPEKMLVGVDKTKNNNNNGGYFSNWFK